MRILRLLVLFSVPVCLCAQSGIPSGHDDLIETPQSLIESDAVAKVLVIHLTDSTMTRVSVTRQALLSMASSTFEITTDIKKRLDPVFTGISYEKESHTPDLRWGVLFRNVHNREIGSVFVDKFGEHGYVNKEAVRFRVAQSGSNLAKELHKLTGDPH